ncbi:hypothetical protein J6590_027948 [Homalodisca vitripennis]|nr:hypothetical protein J6590_027948 [Homalodisca vitripennis]
MPRWGGQRQIMNGTGPLARRGKGTGDGLRRREDGPRHNSLVSINFSINHAKLRLGTGGRAFVSPRVGVAVEGSAR